MYRRRQFAQTVGFQQQFSRRLIQPETNDVCTKQPYKVIYLYIISYLCFISLQTFSYEGIVLFPARYCWITVIFQLGKLPAKLIWHIRMIFIDRDGYPQRLIKYFKLIWWYHTFVIVIFIPSQKITATHYWLVRK